MVGRGLCHRPNEGSHYQNSLERERDTEKDRERDNTQIEGRREGGRERTEAQMNMQVHTPTCPSKSLTQL